MTDVIKNRSDMTAWLCSLVIGAALAFASYLSLKGGGPALPRWFFGVLFGVAAIGLPWALLRNHYRGRL